MLFPIAPVHFSLWGHVWVLTLWPMQSEIGGIQTCVFCFLKHAIEQAIELTFNHAVASKAGRSRRVPGLGVSSEVPVLPVLEHSVVGGHRDQRRVFEHAVAGGHSDQQAAGEEAVFAQEPQKLVDDAPSWQAQTCRPEAPVSVSSARSLVCSSRQARLDIPL